MDSFDHQLADVVDKLQIPDEQLNQYNEAFYYDHGQYIYDDMYDDIAIDLKNFNDSIETAIHMLPQSLNLPLFIKGRYCNIKSFLYKLQKKNCISIALIPSNDGKNIKNRVYLSDNIISHSIPLNITNITLQSCLIKGGIKVAVPLEESTLNSIFWDNTTWREILPEQNYFDCIMSGIKIKYINLRFIIDGYNNVFCLVNDTCGRKKTSLIHNAFGIMLEQPQVIKSKGTINLQNSKEYKSKINHSEIETTKVYVIDTNIFIDDPDILSKIERKHTIIVSLTTIEELDNKKSSPDLDKSVKLRVIRAIKAINQCKNIKKETTDISLLPIDLKKSKADNMILAVALKFKQKNPIMLTSDYGLQSKCETLGISAISLKTFLKQEQEKSFI